VGGGGAHCRCRQRVGRSAGAAFASSTASASVLWVEMAQSACYGVAWERVSSSDPERTLEMSLLRSAVVVGDSRGYFIPGNETPVSPGVVTRGPSVGGGGGFLQIYALWTG
jgi:hypothetical protein